MLRLFAPLATATSTVTPIGLLKDDKVPKKKFKSWGKKVVKKTRKAVKKVLIEPFNIKKKLNTKKKRVAEKREKESEIQEESSEEDGAEGEKPIPSSVNCASKKISNQVLEEQARQMALSLNKNSNANNNISIRRGPSSTSVSKTSYSRLHGHHASQGPMKGVHNSATGGGAGSSGSHWAVSQHPKKSSFLPDKVQVPSVKVPKDHKVDRSSLYKVAPQSVAAGTSPSRVVARATEKHSSTDVVTTTRRRSVSPSPVRTHGSVSSSTNTHTARHHQTRPASPPARPKVSRSRSNSFSGGSLLEKRERTQPPRVRSPSVSPIRSPSIDPPRYAFSKICSVPKRSDESISTVIARDEAQKSSHRHHILNQHQDKVHSVDKSSRHGQTSTSYCESVNRTSSLRESTTTHVSGHSGTPRQRRREQRERDETKKDVYSSRNQVAASKKEPVTPRREDVNVSSTKTSNVAASSSHSSYANMYGVLRRSSSLISMRSNRGDSSVADCMVWHPSTDSTTSSRRNSYAASGSTHKITDTLSADANTSSKKSNIGTPRVKTDDKKSPGQSSAVVNSSVRTGRSSTTTPTMSTHRKSYTSGRDALSKTTVSALTKEEEKKRREEEKKRREEEKKRKEEEMKKEEEDKQKECVAKLEKVLGIECKDKVTVALTASDGGLVGLRNLGNTCYMNSMIQCLSHTVELTQVFLSTDYKLFSGVARGFAKLLQNTWLSTSSPTSSPSTNPFKWVLNKNNSNSNDITFPSISPRLLKSSVNKHLEFFCDYYQHDAQEFMRFFVSGLHEVLKSNLFVPPPKTEGLSIAERGDKTWSWISYVERSPVSKVFMGQLMSTLQCRKCDWTSVTFDPFWDLALPFPKKMSMATTMYGESNTATDLERCLAQFCTEEVLEGDEMPICGKCRKHQPCTKKMMLHKLPPVLVLVLKRFTYLNSAKLNTRVAIPMTLNLRHFLSQEAVKQTEARRIPYELYAVSNHMGSLSSGHYTAWVKQFSTDQWYSCNDSSISKHGPFDVTSGSKFYSSEAYVLFYRRAVH